MKIKNLFISAAFLSAVILGPAVVLADHAVDHTLQQLQSSFHATFASFLTARGSSAPNAAFASLLAAVDESKIKNLESELQSYQSRIEQLKSKPQTARDTREIKSLEAEVEYVQAKLEEIKTGPRLNIARSLKRGSSGEGVKQLQDFLKQFPDVYPQGFVTGNFGPLTDAAVKKLQKKFGLEIVGVVGPKTREKIGELIAAKNHKKHPKITDLSPTSGPIGTKIILTGAGFTLENNAIFVRGKTVLQGLLSDDGGGTISFTLTPNIPCLPDQACPIKVINANGISNARPFKVTQLPLPPEPQPPSELIPPPPPPVAPQIISLSPSFGQVGILVTITGSGFTSTNNSINFGGLTSASIGLASSDGKTLVFKVPGNTPCQPVNPCDVSVTNANGVSNNVSFTLTQIVTPVNVAAPNGGEQFVQGANSIISWTGGTDTVHVALLEEAATLNADPGEFIAGWISTSALPNGSITWDAKQVCDSTGTICSPVAPGNYKILVASEDEFGNVVIWNQATNQAGNIDISDQAFRVLPAPSITVISPNGGEKFIYGTTATISWSATSIVSKTANIKLLKGGSSYVTIASNFALGADTGDFFTTWVVPSTLPVASDYAIEISEALSPSVRDVSDATFTIAPKATISVLVPNGGETWFNDLKGYVRWSSANILSKAVHVDLLKGGIFYRRLASNVVQGYTWSTATYTSGTFNYITPVPSDIPAGNDYTIKISDVGDALVSDVGDSQFTITALPDPVTVSGRLINRFSTAAMANTRLYLDGGGRYMNTGANGEFTVSTTTAALQTKGYVMPVGSWPTCYMNWRYDIFKDYNYSYAYKAENPFWRDHVFDLLADKTGIFNNGTISLGDVPLWPGTGLYVHTDLISTYSPGVYYPDSGYWGWQILALNTDLQVRVWDAAGTVVYLSPSIKIGLENGCTPKTLTFIGGQFAWQPYNVLVSNPLQLSSSYLTYSTFSAGAPMSISLSVSGGVAPYAWSMLYGTLPPGLTLNPTTGAISGTPTTPGTYKFSVKVIDSNGVIGGPWTKPYQIIIK
ncbi:MAG: Ser-Thr-rich GPI-anchored membrane family protein [bacterium]|nr:Ser-Thr-rich GPI-anchored membrane family protein [bacterium]